MPQHNFARPRGRVVELSIESAALAENMLGDPATRTVAVYLPAGYDDSDDHYPLLVDLAAFTGSGLKRLSWSAFGESVPQRLDRLVDEGKMGPVVVAFPDAFTSLGGNQYVDSLALGRWESFLVEDMLPAIEAQVRVRPGPDNRAVYGKSSGGYGALVQGLCHGEQWAAVACQSGDMGFDLMYLRDFPSTLDTLARCGGIEKFLARVQASPSLRGSDFHTLMILAMAASYDPDPTAPCGVRLPVDPHTCALDPTRWQAWLAHDPVQMIKQPEAQRSLRRLRGVFIDCGRHDQYFLHYGARQFVAELERLGIAHHHEEFDGTHSGIDHRLDVSLPWLYQTLTG